MKFGWNHQWVKVTSDPLYRLPITQILLQFITPYPSRSTPFFQFSESYLSVKTIFISFSKASNPEYTTYMGNIQEVKPLYFGEFATNVAGYNCSKSATTNTKPKLGRETKQRQTLRPGIIRRHFVLVKKITRI